MLLNKELKYACIFGGGAVRGISYIGVLDAMRELNIVPTKYAGSSVGAIFAALFAAGYNSKELNDIFLEVNFELFKDINFSITKAFAISKGEHFLDWLREHIEKKFYKDKYVKGKNEQVTFWMLEYDLIIMTTNLCGCSPKEFSRSKTPDCEVAQAVKISASFPGLLQPFEYENGLLVDGDLVKSAPLWKTVDSLCNSDERVLEFRLEGGKNHQKIGNLIDYLNAVYCCISHYSTDFVIELYNNKDMYDYVKIDIESTLLLDFNIPASKKSELVKIGYEATMSYFKEVLPKKKAMLLETYTKILDELVKIRNSFSTHKIITAKNQIGELFILLVDVKDVIDVRIFDDILRFKDLFYANIKKPLFWQSYSLVNEKLVIDEFSKLFTDVVNRCEELEEYINQV